MNVSAKVEYACIAMLDLALMHESGSPIQQRRMSERHGISAQFLVQILQQLKTAGLVTSVRGAAGGYRLTRPPESITLSDVVAAVSGEGDREPFSQRDSGVAKALRAVWQEVEEAQRSVLQHTSLASIARQIRKQDKPMYYI
jgi:Rrf2 family protein